MTRLALVFLLFVAAGCARSVPELRIDGSAGAAPIVRALAEPYMRANPRAPVTLGGGLGTAARIEALLEGRIDMAMASHGVDTAALRRRGIVAHEIARTAVVFGVHESVHTRDVTPAGICGWFTDGHGGPALMRPADEVDAEVAIAALPCLAEAPRSAHVRIIPRADSLAVALARTPGAVGLTSMPYVMGSGGRIRALWLDGIEPNAANVAGGRYPLVRRVYLLTRSPAPEHAARFLAFVRSAEGAQLLGESGAVPVR